MSKRTQKRVKKTAIDFENDSELVAASAKLSQKADTDLFSIDRSGSKSAKRKVVKEVAVAENGKISQSELKLIEKARLTAKKIQYEKHQLHGGIENIRDLWEVDVVKKQKTSNVPVKKTRIALPGQSYNPSTDDHQNVLAEALALEIKKKEAIDQQRTDNITGTYNTDATDLFILDAAESDDEDDSEGESVTGAPRKRKVKLTRAQRNKIKTRKAASFEDHKSKSEKEMIKSIDTLPQILRTIASEEQLMMTRQQLKENQKKLAEEEKLMNVLSYEEASTVPLSDELTGSLRTIIPKGVAVVDRTLHMRKSGDLMKRDRRKRKAYEKPHADKHVVWIPKYKAVTK